MWPIDTRIRTYAAGDPVRSADLNLLQDRIVDLFYDAEITLMSAIPGLDASNHPGWFIDPAHPEYGWECREAGVDLTFPFEVRTDSALHALAIKFFNAQVGAVKFPAKLYRMNREFQNDTTAPSKGSAVVDFSATADVGASAWGARNVSGSDYQPGINGMLALIVENAGVGDRVAGVLINIRPLTESLYGADPTQLL